MSGKRRAAGPAQTTAKGGTSKGAPSKSPAKPKRTPKQWVLRVLKWMAITGLVGALLLSCAFVYLYKTIDIPDPNKDFETQTSFIYYADGKTPLGQFATQNRVSIQFADMPETIRDAVVAAENHTFWTDKGLDPKGILRAAFSNASGNSTQGASTITQQYVKILYLTQERSYKRKIKEAILSLKIQREQSKTQILEGYLNTIYFGRGAYGIEAAAEAYFGKHAKWLTLRESAVLASVLNNPTGLDPANGADARTALKARYDRVLGDMGSLNMVSTDAAANAAKRLPKFHKQTVEDTYGKQRGHMLKLVKDELHALGYTDEEIDGGGMKVTTTFTPEAMKAAKDGVMAARPDGFSDKKLHIAVASVEPGTGALRGFYAGQDYLKSQINWAVAGGMVGSTFKPFTLATALDNGYSLKDTFDGNSPYTFPGGQIVRNEGTGSDGLGNDYGASVSATYALEQSINTAYVDMANSIPDGPAKILTMANKLGIPPAKANKKYPGIPDASGPDLDADALITLGKARLSPINMANAYATIDNGGQRADVHVIDKVVLRSGETYNYKAPTQDAVSQGIADDTSYALQQVVQHGTGQAALALGRPAAGKTGTATNDAGDVSSAWFIGYTPQLATAVMYVRGDGNDKLDGWLPSYFGADYPADTWTQVMQRDMAGLPVEQFPPPANVDGTAPETGHSPYVPPPLPTHTLKPSKTPTTETSTPTETPTPSDTPTTESPSPTGSPTCTILGGCHTPTPSNTPTSTSTPSSSGSASAAPRTTTMADRRRTSGDPWTW